MSPLLAQSRHAVVLRSCLLSGVKRTPKNSAVAAAFDPKQTLDGRSGNLGTWPVSIGLYGIVRWSVLLRIARLRLYGIFVGSRLFERQLFGIGRVRRRNGFFWHTKETDMTSN
jgi:hypothetical protein